MSTSQINNDAGYPDFHGTELHTFQANFLEETRPLGLMVQKLRLGEQLVRSRPTIDDCYKDDAGMDLHRKYDISAKGSELTSDSKKAFRDDNITFDRKLEEDATTKAILSARLIKRCSPFVRSTLATYGAAYTKALDENDYFAIWGFLEASFATGNSAIVLQNLMSLFALKQGAMQHEPFLEKFLASAKIAANDFRDTEHPGYIKTDHLFGAIYLANINAEFFAPKIEQTFDTYQDGKITDFLALTKQFQTYKLKKSTLTASLGTPHDPPPTKAATHRNCITCKAQFPVSPEHPFFKYCQSWINTHRQTSVLPKPPDPPQQYQAMTQPPPDPPTDIDLWSSGEQWLY